MAGTVERGPDWIEYGTSPSTSGITLALSVVFGLLTIGSLALIAWVGLLAILPTLLFVGATVVTLHLSRRSVRIDPTGVYFRGLVSNTVPAARIHHLVLGVFGGRDPVLSIVVVDKADTLMRLYLASASDDPDNQGPLTDLKDQIVFAREILSLPTPENNTPIPMEIYGRKGRRGDRPRRRSRTRQSRSPQ